MNGMKKMLLIAVSIIFVTQGWSQNASVKTSKAKSNENREFRIPLLGEDAPSFTAASTNGKINFPSDFGRSWKVLLSHPQDFTPVCTTEILEMAYLQEELDKMGVAVVVVSTDPLHMHEQWKKAMEEINLNNRGLVKIKFPLVDDENISIAKKYGMIHSESNSKRDVRGVFVIDPDNVIQSISFYPMQIGRSTDELLRTISALKITAEGEVMTPANWKAGSDLLIAIPPKKAADNSVNIPESYYSPAWFLLYKRGTQD